MTSKDDMNGETDMIDDAIVSRAAQWHLRVEGGDMAAADWQGFTEWLEADPTHARAYDQIIEADADLAAIEQNTIAAAPPVPANDEPMPTRRGFLIGGSAVAAAAVAGIVLWPSQSEMTFERYATADREMRTIALAEGISVEMNGDTEIEVASAERPVVRLTRGEAAFVVETGRPGAIRVEAGEITLVDNGTVFNVIRHDGMIRVAVAEGEVIANPDRQAVSIAAGQSLQIREGSGMIERGTIEADAAAAWRRGELVFATTPAQTVAADLGRNLGVTVAIDPAMAGRQLTGVVQLEGDTADIVSETASLLGGRARQSGDGWIIAAN